MDVRSLEPNDVDRVRQIARNSLTASYAPILSTETIERAVAEWYSTEAFDEYLESDEMVFYVAVDNDTVVGFSQSHVVEAIDKGRILWIHVDPEHRGRGIATRLFEETRDGLKDRGIDRITSLVLVDNEEGNRFYTDHGFELLYDRTITIAGEEYVENVYGEPGTTPDQLQPWMASDGERLYIDFDDYTKGSNGPFYVTYRTDDRTRRYGWFCSNCESTDTVMDSMGRIECTHCGNRRRATRWDAAYL